MRSTVMTRCIVLPGGERALCAGEGYPVCEPTVGPQEGNQRSGQQDARPWQVSPPHITPSHAASWIPLPSPSPPSLLPSPPSFPHSSCLLSPSNLALPPSSRSLPSCLPRWFHSGAAHPQASVQCLCVLLPNELIPPRNDLCAHTCRQAARAAVRGEGRVEDAGSGQRGGGHQVLDGRQRCCRPSCRRRRVHSLALAATNKTEPEHLTPKTRFNLEPKRVS